MDIYILGEKLRILRMGIAISILEIVS